MTYKGSITCIILQNIYSKVSYMPTFLHTVLYIKLIGNVGYFFHPTLSYTVMFPVIGKLIHHIRYNVIHYVLSMNIHASASSANRLAE